MSPCLHRIHRVQSSRKNTSPQFYPILPTPCLPLPALPLLFLALPCLPCLLCLCCKITPVSKKPSSVDEAACKVLQHHHPIDKYADCCLLGNTRSSLPGYWKRKWYRIISQLFEEAHGVLQDNCRNREMELPSVHWDSAKPGLVSDTRIPSGNLTTPKDFAWQLLVMKCEYGSRLV